MNLASCPRLFSSAKIPFGPEEIFKLIRKDLVARLVNKYLENGKFITFDKQKIEALKEWIENYNKNLEENCIIFNKRKNIIEYNYLMYAY